AHSIMGSLSGASKFMHFKKRSRAVMHIPSLCLITARPPKAFPLRGKWTCEARTDEVEPEFDLIR
ncbi:MAG: hypothetical protein IIW08_03725, partial [Clostridia bacterium]|nr:hypothetical protein [Clostridia bacterium]